VSELPHRKRAEYWGQAFEVLVKRGVLACLVEQKLAAEDDPRLAAWRSARLASVAGALTKSLDVVDEAARELIKAAFEHLALTAYGLGYTAMREYLRPHRLLLSAGKLEVRGLYCPLTLPGERSNSEDEREAARTELAAAFGLAGPLEAAWTDKGMPARADFLLWLSGSTRDDLLLAQEYSFDMPPELGDFRREHAHLDELLRHRRIVESRSVFARVTAEVEGESFALAEDLRSHLTAFTTQDKPLYKLCQGCGYVEATVRLLRSRDLLAKPCVARALAITPNGLESISARFEPGGEGGPRRKLVEQMAEAYRRAAKLPEDDEQALARKAEEVFNNLRRRLPAELQRKMRELGRAPAPGSDFAFEFEEDATDFANPMQRYAVDEALAMVGDSAGLDRVFGKPAKEAVAAAMRVEDGQVTLRDLHAGAVVAALRAARPGWLNVLALEGNPGIGKTTAVTAHLRGQGDGFLFMYVSPRVVINRDVTDKMARRDGAPSGTLTVTTNAQLIAAADRWHREKVSLGETAPRRVEAAVVVDGVDGLKRPEQGTTVVISPEQEHEIETKHAGSRYRKVTLSEHEDLVQERNLPGVLGCIAATTRELLALNPSVNRVVVTAALQGFREKAGGKTTMDSLSQLFRNRRDRDSGVAERRDFAKRHPTIVVMVDELAGDGAGAPFVHAVGRWLDEEFIDCFDGDSPFTVVLVASDASLANDVVMDRYLNAGGRAPDKVLVSGSGGAQAFKLVASELRLGGRPRPALHVMTNSFPADRLSLRYRVKLSKVALEAQGGVLPTARKAVREAMGESLLLSATDQIKAALESGAQQVIYFAQDKVFLGELKARLTQDTGSGLDEHAVQVLDSSVPASARKRLVQPDVRDAVRVFLMTSSGARGVSFPKTDWIIAAVPRFDIEAALMEIAQLIYRGRGSYLNDAGGEVSGDHAHRHLVMLVDDFVVHEEEIDLRRWLRQALDVMTLLVMLRSTIFTRISGDSRLRQKIALVPVGGVGLEELVSLMAQHVNDFLREAEVFVRRSRDRDRIGTVKNAAGNVVELFQSPKLRAMARKDGDGRSATRVEDMGRLVDRATSAVMPLLAPLDGQTFLPDRLYFAGPVILENWQDFDKQEAFSFEGHQTVLQDRSRRLLTQLRTIDGDPGFPGALRTPAASLRKLLLRERSESENEFQTLKELKSPSTWVTVPVGYAQFVKPTADGRQFRVEDAPAWLDALARSLGAGTAFIPAVPSYESFPWAASVGQADPLRLSLVFDDRYFAATSELNLLNTLLLGDVERVE
jgi:hypothetical protein